MKKYFEELDTDRSGKFANYHKNSNFYMIQA